MNNHALSWLVIFRDPCISQKMTPFLEKKHLKTSSSRWWFQNIFLCSPRKLGKIPILTTLQGTNISLTKAILKMIFLLLRWDMSISRRVIFSDRLVQPPTSLPWLHIFHEAMAHQLGKSAFRALRGWPAGLSHDPLRRGVGWGNLVTCLLGKGKYSTQTKSFLGGSILKQHGCVQ